MDVHHFSPSYPWKKKLLTYSNLLANDMDEDIFRGRGFSDEIITGIFHMGDGHPLKGFG